MDDLKEQVVDDIRSCLISSKGGVPITQINRDYKMIVGHSIPYVKLGFTSLEDFLKSVPGLNVIIKGGECVLEAMPTKNTVHITAMVRGQKSSTNRRKPVYSHFGQRQRPVKKPFTIPPVRRVLLPAEVSKRVLHSPPYLTSLSRSNLPPRLKGQQSHPAVEKISVSPNLHGKKKGPDYQGYGDHERLSYQEDLTLRHANPISSLSPMESSNSASSVLRTPTGVLGPTSPLLEFRMSSGGSGTSRLPPPLMSVGPPVMPQRTSAQSRLSRQFSSPIDKDMKMPSLTPPYDANPFFPKALDNQYSKVHPPLLDNKNLQMSTGASKDKVGFCDLLDNYCKAKKLPKPVYKVITRFPKSNAKQLVCSIKVGIDLGSYSSYPTECKTEVEAIEVASQSALETLEKTFGKLGESLPVTADENLIVSRVAEMLDEHPCGLWSAQLPADYRAIHNETLPEDWLDILRASSLITIDRAAHNRSILLPNRTGSAKRSSTPSSTASGGLLEDSLMSKFDEMSLKAGKKSPEFQQKIDDDVITLGQLNLPEDEFWNVYVSYATSTSNIWIRLIGDEYSALYDEMAADMELFYMSEGGKVAKDLIVGHYYALQVDDCWLRVELTELTEVSEEENTRQLATCFFVDNGDDEIHDASKLRILDSSFTKLPSQAIQCRLNGLEDFSSDQSVESHLVNNIFGRNLVAKAYIGESEEDGMSRPFPSLILFDTSTDENVNLNDVLLEKIIQDAIPPSLLKNGKIQEAYVSYVAQSGSLYIQLPSSIFDYMTKMIEDFSCNIVSGGEDASGKIIAGVPIVHPDVMYLARYDIDMVWYRAVLDSKRSGSVDGKVWVKFVDFGNSELTSLKDLVILPSLNVLCKLPYQAIECRLYNMPDDIQFTQKGLDRCREIVPSEDPVLLKVVASTSDSAAVTTKYEAVDIFKRVQPDNLLASVSTTLAVEEGVFEKAIPDTKRMPGDITDEYGLNYSSKSNERFSKSADVPSEPGILSRTLSAPKVPRVGELFDVHVTIAANPGNFTVQPWKDVSIFSNMMNEMQSVYSSASKKNSFVTLLPEEIEKYRQPLGKDQVIEGGVYAALHEDQLWYRITVSKLIAAPYAEGVMVSGYFLDYGDVAVLMLDKLRKLAPSFYNVPYQAIKAKLAGIAPIHSDWSVEDCLRFQEMVCGKEFVATVVETGPDLIDPTDTVIGINLTDTSDPNLDISIGKTFIEEGRAVAC